MSRWLIIIVTFCCPGLAADVVIRGISDEFLSNVRAHLKLDEASCEQTPEKVRYRFEVASREIKAGLRPFGFYQPDVTADLSFPEAGCWIAEFDVTPGASVLIRHLNVVVTGEGQGEPEFEAVLKDSELRLGDPLHHARYERLKTRLVVVAREHGYFEAVLVANTMSVDVAAASATIDLVLETGPRYQFGELHVTSTVLDESLIERYLEFEPHTPFEQRRLRKLHNDLLTSEYFKEVDVHIETGAPLTKDVYLNLTEGRRMRYGIGVGFGTDTGLIVRGDATRRWMNGRGHRLELGAEVAKVRQNITFDYRIPGKKPQRDWYSIYGGYHQNNTDAIKSRGFKLGVRDLRVHTNRWRSSRFLEDVVDQYLQNGDWRTEQTLVPGMSVTFIDANAPDRPTRGLRLGGEVLGASDQVLSDVSFIRFKVSGKSIMPITKRGRLLLRGELGYMKTDDFASVPPTWRFFAGGDNSVRGYAYQSLGPQDEDGQSLGGPRLMTASAEMDWRFRERWSGAVFTDAGNVGKDNLLEDIPWSVGFGVRWYSPIGPLRLDLAFPQTGADSFRVHVSMGPDL